MSEQLTNVKQVPKTKSKTRRTLSFNSMEIGEIISIRSYAPNMYSKTLDKVIAEAEERYKESMKNERESNSTANSNCPTG